MEMSDEIMKYTYSRILIKATFVFCLNIENFIFVLINATFVFCLNIENFIFATYVFTSQLCPSTPGFFS